MTRPDTDLRAARRALARRLHPDLGGDAEEFARAMAALDRAAVVHPPARPVVVRSRRGRVRAAARRVRTRLPARWPGARRYGSL